MSDRQRLMRVTHERQLDTLLDRELDEGVRRLQSTMPASSTTIRSRERNTYWVGPPYTAPVSGSTSPTRSLVHIFAPASSLPNRYP
jgi:hypothetical protein